MEKILVVDDAKINRMILIEILKKRYEVLEAEDGLEAVAVFRRHEDEIRVVLLDAVMPVLGGYEFLAEARREGWLDKTKVIMISTDYSEALVKRALDEGACDFIARPVDGKTVLEKVERAVSRGSVI